MKTHVTGQPMLGELRQALLAMLLGNQLLSPKEQLRANHHIHECEDVARLTRWAQSVKAELARRSITAHTKKTLAQYITLKRRQLTLPCLRNLRQPQAPRHAPKLTVNALAHRYVTDHSATPRDHHAAAQFQPVRSLTYAQLLRR